MSYSGGHSSKVAHVLRLAVGVFLVLCVLGGRGDERGMENLYLRNIWMCLSNLKFIVAVCRARICMERVLQTVARWLFS